MSFKRVTASTFLLISLTGLGACISHENSAQSERDANSAAGKAGKMAHKAAKEAGKAAREAGRELGQAARQAKAGWDEAAREDNAKQGR
jgi:hypothetical protein